MQNHKFEILVCYTVKQALEICVALTEIDYFSNHNWIAVIFQLFTAGHLMDFTEIIQPW